MPITYERLEQLLDNSQRQFAALRDVKESLEARLRLAEAKLRQEEIEWDGKKYVYAPMGV